MPYAPQTGLGSTVTVGGVAFNVRDHSITLTRETHKASRLTDVYDTYHCGRAGATISVNVIVDTSAANPVSTGFMSQTVVGTAVTFALVDAGGTNTYNGSAYITSCQHTMTADDVDIIAVELQVTGEIT